MINEALSSSRLKRNDAIIVKLYIKALGIMEQSFTQIETIT